MSKEQMELAVNSETQVAKNLQLAYNHLMLAQKCWRAMLEDYDRACVPVKPETVKEAGRFFEKMIVELQNTEIAGGIADFSGGDNREEEE